ncbi:MAG: methionine aminotransferase [Bacteroidetes bacterium]|nr:methionine aminotransferase [Bacteroidota bacterium]MDA1120386.1 methionine aminotransferase [Bacteroidota bacterium]
MIYKLPNTGTSIFTIMSKMALDYNAINLSQGFPDFEVSPEVISLINKHMMGGRNQYAPMPGVPVLLERIASKVNGIHGCKYDGLSEVTVTAGATESIYSAITMLVHPGDEVIIFEPAYDSYEPNVLINGGVPVRIKLRLPDFSIPWDEVRQKITNKTRLIVINSPHNPTGSALSKEDMLELSSIVTNSEIYVLSDEVYEHIIFDGLVHESILKYPEIMEKGICVSSFGKTFHATGWKIGYSVAPRHLTEEIRKIHQFVTFSVNTPIQWAFAEFLENPENYKHVPAMFQNKRDLFLEHTKNSRFKPFPSYGTYFQLMSYEGMYDLGDYELAQKLTKESGLASIPMSFFYKDRQDDHILRFCFAKSDETLEKGAEICCKL